jgi:hypothetical protein
MSTRPQPLAFVATSHFTLRHEGGQSAQVFGTSNGHSRSHRLPNNQAVTEHILSAPLEALPAEHSTNNASDVTHTMEDSDFIAEDTAFTNDSDSPPPAELSTSASDSDRLSTTATTPGISTATCTCFLCVSSYASGSFKFRHDELCRSHHCDVIRNHLVDQLHICFLGCGELHNYWYSRVHSAFLLSDCGAEQHLKTHFSNEQGDLQCQEPGCKSTFKRKPEFDRHAKKHCLNAKKLSCNFPGCNRIGDNGFTRRDKLNDHRRNGHKVTKVKANQGGNRALLPKV